MLSIWSKSEYSTTVTVVYKSPIRDPLELEGHTQAENEGMEKIFQANGTKRKQEYLYLYQTK